MKIYRPLWSEGAFLAPQQFQQQTRWDAYVADVVARMSLSSPWGVISAEFDESALAVFRLNPVNLVVRFPDGTLVDTSVSDNLPPACDLSHLTGYNNVDVVLALPLLSANGGNLSLGGGVSRPCRWQQEWLPVQDLSGQERTDMAVLRNAITLRYAHDDNSAYLTCPVACLIRNAQGQWEFAADFLPPSLSLTASPLLMNLLSDLVHRIRARCRRLMALRRESNERMADFAVADVSLFWLLNALNSAEPVLSEMLENPGRHPELLWRELARLAGSLLTFSLDHDVNAVPPYQHTHPDRVFPPLFALLVELLEASLPSRVVSIELIQERQFWYGVLADTREYFCYKQSDFIRGTRMSALNRLLAASMTSPDEQQRLMEQAQAQTVLWQNWLLPISEVSPGGEDPGYDDDFQRMREEVNKLSGAQTDLIIALAEKLLTTTSKDVRVVTYYTWARLHRDGEPGLADGLTLLAGLMQRYGDNLHPLRANSHKAALEWLAGGRMLDSLARYPEVSRPDAQRITGALILLQQMFSQREENLRPGLGALYSALENRLVQSGGAQALVPQNIGVQSGRQSAEAPALKSIASGRELLEQTRVLAKYLRDQPDGWLAAHHLMKSVRLDTVCQLPPPDGAGRTRLIPPKSDYRAQLKRLYLQQSWTELIELTDSLFAEGVNHFWLDVQWYLHQAVSRAGTPWDKYPEIIISDLKMLLHRMPGLETLAFNDGTPFADDVTREWITRDVMQESDWQTENITVASAGADDDILLLESEALALADSEGIEVALAWLQARPGIISVRQRWLRQLLMARLTEQCGRNDLALHLLGELNTAAQSLILEQWEPELLFEVKARRLKLLRLKANRSESDKTRLAQEMDALLSGLIAIDPARAAVLCG